VAFRPILLAVIYPEPTLHKLQILFYQQYKLWNPGCWRSSSNPLPAINNNNFINNTNYNIRLETYQTPATTIVNALNNWYNTTDTIAIKAKLYHRPNSSTSAHSIGSLTFLKRMIKEIRLLCS